MSLELLLGEATDKW